MVEWLERMLRNHRIVGSPPAGSIIHVAHNCERIMSEIELNLCLALQDPVVIKPHK